jgi:hypothetical protein
MTQTTYPIRVRPCPTATGMKYEVYARGMGLYGRDMDALIARLGLWCVSDFRRIGHEGFYEAEGIIPEGQE